MTRQKPAYLAAGGGLLTSLTDMMKFGQMMVNGQFTVAGSCTIHALLSCVDHSLRASSFVWGGKGETWWIDWFVVADTRRRWGLQDMPRTALVGLGLRSPSHTSLTSVCPSRPLVAIHPCMQAGS